MAESADNLLYVLSKSALTQVGVLARLQKIEIYTSNTIFVVTETAHRLELSSHNLPDFDLIKPSEYFQQHFINIRQLSDSSYKLVAQTRGLGGGTGGSTPASLYNASKKGDVSVVNALILIGDNVNEKQTENEKSTPLHAAASYGHTECAQLLLNAKANINTINSNGTHGWTPLMNAAYNNRINCVKLLLECNANTTHTDDGRTALKLAYQKKHSKIVAVYQAIKPEIVLQELVFSISQRAIELAAIKKEQHDKINTLLVNALLAETKILHELTAVKDEAALDQEAIARQLANEIPIIIKDTENKGIKAGVKLKCATLRKMAIRTCLKSAILRGFSVKDNKTNSKAFC